MTHANKKSSGNNTKNSDKNIENLPKLTSADYAKLRELENNLKNNKGGDHSCLNFQNSFDWSAYIFEKDGKYGLKSAIGEIVLPANFEDFKLLSNTDIQNGDKVVVKQNGKWGVLKAGGEGTWLIDPEFDYIGYPNNFTHVCKNDKWGVLNIPERKFLIPLECDTIQSDGGFMFINGVGIYEKDGKLGLVTENGEFTEPVFNDTDWDMEGGVKVLQNDQWGYVNEDGQFTTDEDEAYYGFWD